MFREIDLINIFLSQFFFEITFQIDCYLALIIVAYIIRISFWTIGLSLQPKEFWFLVIYNRYVYLWIV